MIGIFDSGIGGLSVLTEINKQIPNEKFIYIADAAFTPYGEKTEAEIIERCMKIVDYFVSQHVDIVVVACNTATAIAVNKLRQKYKLPIVAMEPAVKPAVENSTNGIVGILATTMTLSSHRYAHLLERFASGVKVFEQACPGLVEQVEKMQQDSVETKQLLHKYIDPLVKKNIDTIVLGCTHYPFLKEQIKEIVGQRVKVIDTAIAVTLELKRKLNEIGTVASLETNRFLTTGSVSKFNQQLDFFYANKPVSIEKLDIDNY